MVISGCWQALRRVCSCGCSSDAPENTAPRQRSRSPISGAGGAAVAGERRRDAEIPEAEPSPAATNTTTTATNNKDNNKDEFLVSVLQTDANRAAYPSNAIHTARYTIWTCVPLGLIFQFRKVSNCYFLLVMMISLVPGASPINPMSSILPLSIVLGVGMAKDLWEDWKRRKADEYANNIEVHVLRDVEEMSFTAIQSSDLVPGDVVLFRLGEEVRADCIILNTSLPQGLTYVETSNLDGETNAKTKRAQHQLLERVSTVEDVVELVHGRGSTMASSFVSAARPLSATIPLQNRGGPTPPPLPSAPTSMWERPASGSLPPRCDDCCLTSSSPHPRRTSALFSGDATIAMEVEELSDHNPFEAPNVLQVGPVFSTPDGADDLCPAPTTAPSSPASPSVVVVGAAGPAVGTALIGTSDDRSGEGFSIRGSTPVADLSSWYGQAIVANREKISLGIDQFIPRGCVIRNTEWVLAVVLYTGTNTKMLLNLRPRPVKGTTMSRRLNWLNLCFFMVNQCIMVTLCSLAVWFKHHKLTQQPGTKTAYSAWYIQWQLEQYSDVHLFGWRYLTNFVLVSYLIPMSLYVTLEGVKAYQMHLIAVDHCMSVEDPFSTEPGARRFAQPKTSELNSQLSQVRFVFTDKTGTLTENLMTYVGGYVSGSYHDEREAPGGLGRSLLRKFMRYQQRMMAASPHPHMFSRSASFSSIRRVSDQLHRRIMTTDRSGGMSTGESADHPVPWLRIPSRQEEISFLALEPSIHMANRAAAASAAFGPMRSFDANASAQHLPAEDDLEENDAYCYLRAMALCHTVVCFTQETDDEKVVADAIGEPKKKHGAHATEGGKEASPLRAKKKVRIAPGAGSPSQQRRRQRRVLEEGSPRSQAGAPMLQLPQILHASTDDGTSHGGGGGAATSAHFAHQRTSTGLGVSRPTLYGEGAEEEVATTNPDGSRRRRLVHRRFHPIGAGTSVTSTNVLPMPTPSGMHAYYSSMQMDELTSLPHGSASPPNLPSRHGRTLSGSGVLRGDVSAFHTPHAPALSGALMGGGGGVGAAMGSVGALHTLSRTVSASQLPLYHRHTESAQSMHTLALGADVLTMDGLVDRSKLYEGQSLDEIALVSAARENGFCLYERSAKYMYIKVFGQVMCYEIVAELEFTAQRKLMSIILRRYPAGDTEEHANSAATKSGSGAPSHYRRSPSSAQAADTTSSPLPKDDGQQQEDSRRPYPTTENLSAVPSQTSTMSPYGSPFGIDGSPDFTGGRQRTDVFVEATGTAAPRPGTAPGRGATTTTTASAAADVVVVQDSPSMTMMSEKKRIPPRPPLPSPPQPPPLSGLIPPPPPPPPQQPPHYLMLTKGADSSMMGIVNMAHHKNAALKPVLSKQLDATAKLGLRTLVLGQRRLTESEVQAWLPIYEQALCTMENRNEQLHAAYAMIERDVDLVGATAVEDKLQDGVPETLEFLSQAQIVVWMLTGDKRETAVTIAQTSGLVSPAHHDGIVHLDISDMLDEAEKMQQTSSRENSTSGTNTTTTSTSSSSSSGSRESSEANLYSGDLCGECSGSSGERRSGSPTSAELQAQRANMAAKLDAQIDVAVRACEESMAQYGSSKTVIVVDGKTLDFIFGDDDRTKRFFDLGCLCRSAVCCRMTPLQKAQVVRLFQHRTGAIALGIGDGANDVYMIQESKIGVGIMGLEGSQAELASDYALPKFRFLKRLLMVHGRASYYREAHCILYSLYKNVILTVGMVGYCFFCGYSGQAFVDSWFISLFSVIYCCLQPIVLGVFDKDVDDELAESVPLLYPVLSREDTYFSPAYMFKWLLDGFVEGVLFFCYVIFVVGRHNDLYAELQGSVEDYGQLFFTMLVVVADLRAFATASYFTIIVVGILGLELIGVPCFGIMVCSLHIIFGSNWNVYVAQELYGTSRSFWLGILFAVGLMSIITLGIPLFVQLFRPWKSAGIAYNTARSSSFRALHHEEVHALMKELKEREDLQKEKERQCDLLNLHFS